MGGAVHRDADHGNADHGNADHGGPEGGDDARGDGARGDGAEPYAGFRGTIGRTMGRSESWWPPRPIPGAGAPNVVVMLVDDVGFSDIGCFGGEIDTPNLDRLAADGVRFTNFHVNPMCSPTRASLLTGVNCHAAGVGHVAQDDPGFPGYAGELADNVATVAEIMRDAGYATLMVGKWHLCRDADVSAAGPQHSWPCQRGFDRFYGILDAFTNLHHPHRLVRDNSMVDIDEYPPGYFLTDDLTGQAVRMIRERKASRPDQPFLLYFAHPAAHAPLVAKADDIARYQGRFDAGWDEIRAARHQRQIELGILPAGTALAPRNAEPGDDVAEWAALSADERRLYARYMEVYAAMVDEIDQSMGTLRAALEVMGEWDNTIVVFLSDNGASREGEATGTTNYYHHLTSQPGGVGTEPLPADLDRLDLIGSAQAMAHYPRGWAMASGTPWRLYKRNTHAGGHRVPCIWHWPAGRFPAGFRRQYGHCTDITPTLLDLAGLDLAGLDLAGLDLAGLDLAGLDLAGLDLAGLDLAGLDGAGLDGAGLDGAGGARSGERHGRATKAIDGATLAGALRDPAHGETHLAQYYELAGHRGMYRDGWEVVTRHPGPAGFSDDEWELYDTVNDPTETRDLAAERADLVASLAAAWEEAATANQVFPLDEGTSWRYVVRPPHDQLFDAPVTIYPGTPTLERWRSSRFIWSRNCTISISATFAAGAADAADAAGGARSGDDPAPTGDVGVLVAHGDQGGGYVVYVEHGRVWFAHNDGYGRMTTIDGGPVSPGSRLITVELHAPGRRQWNVSLRVDDGPSATAEGLAMPFPMAPFEGIDVGADRRSPVSWDLFRRHGAFAFTGELHWVRYEPGELAPDNGTRWLDFLKQSAARFD